MAEIAPMCENMGENAEPITKADIRKVLIIVSTLCQFMFNEYALPIKSSRKTTRFTTQTRK